MSINFYVGEAPPGSAKKWAQSGNCDIVAVALHRAFGLPINAEFEWGYESGKEVLGFLSHAWAVLPDGRMLDAQGISPAPEPQSGKDANDAWVEGYRIVALSDRDPHFVDIRETDDTDPFTREIRESQAIEWVVEEFGTMLAALGITPNAEAAKLHAEWKVMQAEDIDEVVPTPVTRPARTAPSLS